MNCRKDFRICEIAIVVCCCLLTLTGATTIFQNSTTEEATTEDPSTAEPTTGPDDLVLVDWIIIGVTCTVFTGVVIGGIVFACIKHRESKKEKDELYHKYLDRDDLEYIAGTAAATSAGKDNPAYVT